MKIFEWKKTLGFGVDRDPGVCRGIFTIAG